MTRVGTSTSGVVTDDLLRQGVQDALASTTSDRRIVALRRLPSAYATSTALEEVTVSLSDGSRIELMLKTVDVAQMRPRTRRAKPDFVINPIREIAVYRSALAPHRLAARLYAAGADMPRGRSWLLVEKVSGVELYQAGDLNAWCAASRWIAGLHAAWPAADVRRLADDVPLLEYNRDFYHLWLERVRRFFACDAPPSRHDRAALAWLLGKYERVVERLLQEPITLVHGEYYASNVLVSARGTEWVACPVDWEMAAAGPGVLDLAALTAGDWDDESRRRIIAAYAGDVAATPPAALIEAVAYAQVYLGIQWLGWFGRRRPPAEHARDWLADAITNAESLRL